MKISQIQRAEGVALRIDLLPNRGRFSLILLVTGLGTLAFFPWTKFLDNGYGGSSLFQLTLLASFWLVFSLASYFGRHVVQIEPDGHIRKGLAILGFRIWLGKVAITRIAGLHLDPGDPDNPVLSCLDPSGASILAIEGLRDIPEAEEFSGYLWRLLGDHDTAVREYVEDIKQAPPSEPRRSLRWMLVGVTVLVVTVLSFWNSGSGLRHHLVSTTISVAVVAITMVAILPDEKITYTNADEGIVRGWVRRRYLWIEYYTRELKEGPARIITRMSFDRGLLIQGGVLAVYGVIVFLIVSRPKEENSGARADEQPRVEYSREELERIRKGAERLKEHLEKRERENK